jgi:hypothetical protein
MDRALRSRAVVMGHLTLTAPAIVVTLLVPFQTWGMLGPTLIFYYLLAGIALAWQWYLVALPGWKKWLAEKGAPDGEVDDLAHRAGLAWPVDAAIGPFALHTAAAALCGIHMGPWLVSRWFLWIRPLAGMSARYATGNDFLQNFELASIVPALVLGYLLSKRSARFASYAWILPTAILGFRLLTFAEPRPSVFASHPLTRYEYFFLIQRTVPTFTSVLAGVDPIRVAQQMFAVAPFYAGLSYSVGATAVRHNLLKRIFGHLPVEPDSETT